VPRLADLPLRAARRVFGMTALDHLVRIQPVLGLLEELGSGTLLDAGSGSLGLSPWLGGAWSVTAVDTAFDDYGASHGFAGRARAVVADVRELPFGDKAFDAVVALDLLEHVPAEDRERALSELRRVTRRRLIVAGPTGAQALAADRRLASMLRKPPGWLVEHISLGFPTREQVASALEPYGTLYLLENENVSRHVWLVRAELSIPGFVVGRLSALALARALRRRGRTHQLAARSLWRIRGRDRQPAYRTIAILDVPPARHADRS
jgi:SAM-dependent methyltransferase